MTIQIIRTDRDFFIALDQTQSYVSEQLKRALLEFYVQPHREFFEGWNRNNKERTVEAWIDKLVEHIKRYPSILEAIRTQFPTREMEALLMPALRRAQALAGVKKATPVYFVVGAFEDNAFTTNLPAIGFCLEWFLPVEFWETLDLPEAVRRFITSDKGLMALYLTHEYAHTVQRLSLFEAESLTDVVLGEGMAVLFSEHAYPGRSLEDYLGLTKDQLTWCKEHEQELWFRFQEDINSEDLSDQTIKSYLSPFGVPLLEDAPPRVGYYIGYRVCKSYLSTTDGDMKKLLALSSAAQIIEESKYNP